MTARRTYWQRLKDHPGVPGAAFMTFAGFLVGLDRGVWFAVFAACVAGGWCWGFAQDTGECLIHPQRKEKKTCYTTPLK